MSWLGWLTSACSRRHRAPEGEKAFWEDLPDAKEGEEGEGEEDKAEPLAYEQAVHLKDEGNEKFARGSDADVSEATRCWLNALDALCEPPRKPEGEEPEELPVPSADDPKVQELRTTLLLNLALGHKKLKQWRQAVSFCEEVLLDQPQNVKALYRKADALGELCDWKEAEDAAARLEETGAEGKKLASQKREEWKKRRKAADGRQKKMWSAALDKSSSPQKENGRAPEKKPMEVSETWVAPKVEQMSVFDLRRKGLEWVEAEDFDDSVWKDGLGVREATYYQRRALPLTFLAAASLAEVDLDGEVVVHCILDGNMAPFAEPHDWSLVLQRCPSIRSLTVVYVDIGAVGDEPHNGPPSMPYGMLMRPTEEGRVGDRVARAARFMGTYKEFKDHCLELPGLVAPRIALWADVPLYGFSEDDFATRLETFEMLDALGVPSVITQAGEVPVRGGPPMAMRVDDQASLSMAILGIGLGAAMIGGWCWNRFVVPLDRGTHGVLAGHALLGTVKPTAKRSSPLKPSAVKDALVRRGVAPAPYQLREPGRVDSEAEGLRRRQYEAFAQKLRAEGRPVGMEADAAERHRQSMEFYQFCGLAEPSPAN